MHAAVLGFYSQQDRNFNFFRWAEIWSDSQLEPQSLVSAPIYNWVSTKSLRSAFIVKAHVLLKAIQPSGGDVKPVSPVSAFDKGRLIPTPILTSYLSLI